MSVGETGVYLGSRDGKESRGVLPGTSGAWLAAGRLLFIRDDTLLAQPFDATTGQAVGEAVPLADGVSGPVSASETGVLLYQMGGAASRSSQMAWFDRGGKFLAAIGAPGQSSSPALSPYGKA